MPYYLLTLHKIRMNFAKCVYIDLDMNAQTKKSGQAKLSQSGKVGKWTPPERGKVWRLVALFLLGLLILLGIVAAILWHNRTHLAEAQIRKFMADNGYDITLDVNKLSKNQITATNIVVGKTQDVFFKSAKIVADYDLAERKVLRVKLIKPYLKIEFDTGGKITSSWIGQSTTSPQKLALPPGGVTIKDAKIDWRLVQDEGTLFGSGQADISADISSDTDWSANIVGNQAVFNTDSLRGDIQHDVFVETKDGKSFDVFGSVSGKSLTTTLLPLENLRIQSVKSAFKLHYANTKEVEAPILTGWHEVHIAGISTQDYAAKLVDLKFENLRVDADGPISANWQMKTENTRIHNEDMRTNLADKLTAHSVMANLPIAQYFAKTLYGKAERLLNGFAVDGSGSIVTSAKGYEISLGRPLSFNTAKQTVSFAQISSEFVRFNKEDKSINVHADMKWTGVQALTLNNFALNAKSTNGIKLDTVKNMKARVYSQKTWRLHKGGDDIRLAPFDFNFTYIDQGNTVRTVNLNGAIDYAGPVPGGSVLGLKAGGDMDVRLVGRDFTLGFTPSTPLFIGEFTNPSGWTAKSVNFILEPQASLLRKTAQSGAMRTTFKDVSTQIIGPENKRHLDGRFERMDITTDFAKFPQHWQIQVSGADIKSEDFPAPGTHIIAPSANLEVIQSRDGNMTFDILSPMTRAATDNAVIEDLHINLNGSPDDIALAYQAGSVTMVGGAVPVLPMHGTARLKSGELSGHAITNLPLATNTPIDIHYRSKGGQGSAKILIPKINFAPEGLQPQYLVPILRGKLAEVTGEVSAEFDFVFGGGNPVQSSGWAELKNLDVGTLVGPFSGVNSQLTFTSIFPLKTDGVQTTTMAGFNPGFPLSSGNVRFEIIPTGIRLHQVQWPIENIYGTPGKIFLAPTVWQFGNVENLVTVNVENVGLDTILAGAGEDKLSATGQVYGTLPAKVKGVELLIDGGILAVKDGGVIQYKNAATDNAVGQNETAAHAFKALENFRYKQLEAHIDGPLDGTMALKIMFDGQNPEVLSGQTFLFNTVVTGELTNIARNLAGAFSNEENLKRIIDIQDGKQPEQHKSDE